MLIKCSGCNVSHHLKGNMRTRDTARADVVSVGLHCPRCDAFTHIYYDSAALKAKRNALSMLRALLAKQRGTLEYQYTFERYQQAKANSQKLFDALKEAMTP